MSEQKLKLPQKVFAAIERIIKDTRVKDADLSIVTTPAQMELEINANIAEISTVIPMDVLEPLFNIEVNLKESIGELMNTTVQDAQMEALEAVVKDEKVESINTAALHDEPLGIETTVWDFFKKFQIKPMQSYKAEIKSVGFERVKTKIYRVPLRINTGIKENLPAFKRLVVFHKPVILNFLSEREQLEYWRMAVVQTRKEVKKLQLFGVYSGVPYSSIEKIKINYSKKRLCYNFKPRTAGKGSELNGVAIFNDTETNKTLLVVK
jgi:hypothetical protein